MLPAATELTSQRGRRATSALTVLALVALAGCPNPTKDAHCEPDAPSRDLDASCIYAGNGNGPEVPDGTCTVPGTAPAQSDCDTAFSFDEIQSKIVASSDGCARSECHGDARQAGIFFDVADPQQVYATLTTITGSVGSPYVVPGEDGWMYCSVAAIDGGGVPQPPPGGLDSAEDVSLVQNWILCGAEGP